MHLQFYDDPTEGPRAPEDVRFNNLGLYVYDDQRRVAVGFDIAPFREPPSIQVIVTNESGQEASSLTVINTLRTNFNLTMHLRDERVSDQYTVNAQLFYPDLDGNLMIVDEITRSLDVSQVGTQ